MADQRSGIPAALLSIPPQYLVNITSSRHGSSVWGILPKDINTIVQCDFGDGDFGDITNTATELVQKTTGTSLNNRYLTAQVYKGQSPFAMTIPFRLEAVENPAAEVMSPIKELKRMALPLVNPGTPYLMHAPGPNLAFLLGLGGGGAAGDTITVSVGSMFAFTNVIVDKVDATYHCRLGQSGMPMAASVSVTFRTFWALAAHEIDQVMFAIE